MSQYTTARDALSPWLRRIVVTLGPLEEWRGQTAGEIVRFESNGTPQGLKVSGTFCQTLKAQPQKSTITVSNLARNTRDAIREKLTKITVETGWNNTELSTLFQGSVMSAHHNRSGSDIVTTITAQPGLGACVRGISNKTYAPGMSLRDVIRDLVSDLPGLAMGDSGMEGINSIIGNCGWSFSGRTKDALNQLATEYGFSWHIDKGLVKALGDKAVFGGKVDLDGQRGGLISVSPLLSGPMQVQTGVNITALYVPGVTAGNLINVTSDVVPKLNGEYKVHSCSVSVDAHSDAWTMNIEAFKIPR